MAIKRATFTITADTLADSDYDDVRLSGFPSSGARHGFLERVTLTSAYATRDAKVLRVLQLEDDDQDTPVEQVGEQLFSIAYPQEGVPYYPRVAAVDTEGVALSGAFARPVIRSSRVRVAVDGGVSGDIYVVVLYYETAGDYRF